MKDSNFLIIDKEILPDIFIKVVEAKELLKRERVKSVTEAVKQVGISRSAFYKYKDFVYPLADASTGKKVTLSFLLSHITGVLSDVLQIISKNKCNILTINQESPVNNVANVNIVFDISSANKKIEDIIVEIESVQGVEKLNLVAIERQNDKEKVGG